MLKNSKNQILEAVDSEMSRKAFWQFLVKMKNLETIKSCQNMSFDK